jgi:hypothetical protein
MAKLGLKLPVARALALHRNVQAESVSNMGWFFLRSVSIISRCGAWRFSTCSKEALGPVNQQLRLEDWAWRIAADVYRLNLYSQLTGRTAPRGIAVTDDELAEAIRDSFTQVNEAAYRDMVDLATDAALEAYDRVVSRSVRQSRARRSN